MNTLVLVAGLPGNGKTTIAKKTAGRLNGKLLDLDEFKRQVVDPNLVRSEIDPPHVRRAYYLMALEAGFAALKNGFPIVVLEEIFHLSMLRKEISARCERESVRVLWVEVLCDFETVRSRLVANGRPGHILSTDEALAMNRLFNEVFESFTSEERCLRVDNSGDNPELLVNTIMTRLMESKIETSV
jgi:predicted kinase